VKRLNARESTRRKEKTRKPPKSIGDWTIPTTRGRQKRGNVVPAKTWQTRVRGPLSNRGFKKGKRGLGQGKGTIDFD